MPQTHAPAAPPKPPEPPEPPKLPKLEDLLKRIEALEITVGLAPRPPRKDTVTAYYKDKTSGKTVVYELPPVVYEEAKNGRLVATEQPSLVTDENGQARMAAVRWIVPEDAAAWSLEDPDAKDSKAK